jgi:hypothetical protein
MSPITSCMVQPKSFGTAEMKSSRIAVLAFAAIVGLGALANSAPASATDWSWLGNKPYVDCLKLMQSISHGGGIWGSVKNPAQQAQGYDNGRRQCNMKYYGHQ